MNIFIFSPWKLDEYFEKFVHNSQVFFRKKIFRISGENSLQISGKSNWRIFQDDSGRFFHKNSGGLSTKILEDCPQKLWKIFQDLFLKIFFKNFKEFSIKFPKKI